MNLCLVKTWLYLYLFLLSVYSSSGLESVEADNLGTPFLNISKFLSRGQEDAGSDFFSLITTNVAQNFSQANNICKAISGGDSNLARIDDIETYNRIVYNIANISRLNHSPMYFWVGIWDPKDNSAQHASGIERFAFLDGNNAKVSFIHDSIIWRDGEPSNGDDENCVIWSSTKNKLSDVKCSTPLTRFLCRQPCSVSLTASPTQPPTVLISPLTTSPTHSTASPATSPDPGTPKSPTFDDSRVNDPSQNVLKYIWMLIIIAVEASLIILFGFWCKMTRSSLKALKKALVENEAIDPSSRPAYSSYDYMPAASL